MKPREIEVIIDQDGTVSIEAIGYDGPDCEEATDHIERALGRIQARQRKPEYYRRHTSTRRVRAG